MSHVVEIAAEVRDHAALTAACRRMGVAAPEAGKHRLFSRSESGHAVCLPGWRYPVVCQLQSGKLKYDNYEGRWGHAGEPNRLLQTYAVEKNHREARRAGHRVSEQTLGDGSIKLTVLVNS